ncbi:MULTISPECIES: hypothetical protein [Bacillota]|uniref:hypothetical protein n=1 Tax=Bacillota TaxID=1239 RepID=UPI0039F09FDE
MLTRRSNSKKKLKRLLIVIFVLQTLFFIIPGGSFMFMNVFHTKEGTEESYERLEEQKELFTMPAAWILFGPWNAVMLAQINHEQKLILNNGFNPEKEDLPIGEQIENLLEDIFKEGSSE